MAPPPSRRTGRPLALLAVGVLLALAILGGLAALIALPAIVRSRCVAAAAERGVLLTVDSVSLGLGGVRLVKVGFTLEGVPQLTGGADAIDVGLSGLTPTTANATGLAVAIDGAAAEVQAALDAWRAAHARGPSGGPAGATGAPGPSKLSFAGSRLTWTRAFGQTARLEAVDAQGEVDGASDAVKVASEKVTLATGRATLGPWRASLERDAQGTRTHLELDPVVRGGPQATYVRDAAGVVSLRVTIPSSPLSRLGVPAKSVGLGSDPTVEGNLDFEEGLAGASTLKTTLLLSKATFSGMPIDAKLDLYAAGDAAKGLDVKKGDLAAGPLHATVTGSVKLFPDGVRMALSWRSTPLACAAVAKALTAQTLGPLGAELGAMAEQVTGALGVKVAGSAVASGVITVDTRDLGATTTSMTTNDTCGIALF